MIVNFLVLLQILALYETHLPHSLDPYTLETLGLDDLNGSLKLGNCAVHYRIDPDTMVCVHFKYIIFIKNLVKQFL